MRKQEPAAARIVERLITSRGELALRRRGEVFEIISNGTFLMDTSDGRSERLLARAATRGEPRRRVLVGGLGVGFTLAEVLGSPHVESVTVVEIEEAIVRWNAGPLAAVNGNALSDARVRVVVADLRAWAARAAERFDAICLDVDNGPDWTVTEQNLGLYTEEGLRALKNLLVIGGRLAVWSASPAPEFERRLAAVVGDVRIDEVAAATGAPDVVWVATRRD